mmetsp:Transcript_44065/g.107677  ORF Transcript_44065/g.107677 Transcript_44065/m.107677 type:complete len:250 (+) Transcript_44065:474-1223(+)
MCSGLVHVQERSPLRAPVCRRRHTRSNIDDIAKDAEPGRSEADDSRAQRARVQPDPELCRLSIRSRDPMDRLDHAHSGEHRIIGMPSALHPRLRNPTDGKVEVMKGLHLRDAPPRLLAVPHLPPGRHTLVQQTVDLAQPTDRCRRAVVHNHLVEVDKVQEQNRHHLIPVGYERLALLEPLGHGLRHQRVEQGPLKRDVLPQAREHLLRVRKLPPEVLGGDGEGQEEHRRWDDLVDHVQKDLPPGQLLAG